VSWNLLSVRMTDLWVVAWGEGHVVAGPAVGTGVGVYIVTVSVTDPRP
jgi:hypothetical protein